MRWKRLNSYPEGIVLTKFQCGWNEGPSTTDTRVFILLHFGAGLGKLRNPLCTLPPALPPPSFLTLSIESAQSLPNNKNKTKAYLCDSLFGGDAGGQEISLWK